MKYLLIIIVTSLFLFSCNKQETEAQQKRETNTSKSSVASEKKDAVKSDNFETNTSAKPAASGATYILGEDYELLANPYATGNNEKVVVYEFFGYTCSHCFDFEPFIEKWLASKAGYVKLERVPLNFQQGWANLQQAYLTAEIMGLVDKTHNKLFAAIHKDHKRFNSIDELADWYEQEASVDKDAFLSTADSFILDSKQRKADKMGFAMEITATPSVVVNGKYKISKKVRNRDEIINIIRYLAKMEANEMGLIK